MDENNYLSLIASQIGTLKASAAQALGEDHAAVRALNNCYESLTLDALDIPARVTPNGFTPEAFEDFLTEQAPVLENEGTDAVVDVVGTLVDENGTITEIGDAEASFAQARDIVAAHEEDAAEYGEDDIEVENSINVTYTRLDGQALTLENVQTIINHPVSAALKHFGAIQLVDVKATDNASEKQAVFAVLEEGAMPLKALALQVAAYRGITPIAGLGRIQAVGTVNFV